MNRAQLRSELNLPQTKTGQRYFALLIVTIVLSILYLFIQEEYPQSFPRGSLQLFAIEFCILVIFTFDFFLRLFTVEKSPVETGYLIIDFLAIIPSLVVVLQHFGFVDAAQIELLALLRLFRLARILKLLRQNNAVVSIFGASVLTLVFGVMAFHLGIRVALLALSSLTGFDVEAFFDRPILMIAITAVGAVFGIALAITFGIVKSKQIEITQMHRIALDALDAMEQDINALKPKSGWKGASEWRLALGLFLSGEISYSEIKTNTNDMLAGMRREIIARPSFDVPFHNNLVPKISAFLTKTQIRFHPVFYTWLNRIAQLYFLLVLLAAPGLTGVLVQLLVIFVFQGLVVMIYDMDHAISTEAAMFNSKILDV